MPAGRASGHGTNNGVQLGMQLLIGRKQAVALQHHTRQIDAGTELGQEIEHRRRNTVPMRVMVKAVALDAAGNVDISDPLQGNPVEELDCVVAVVASVGIIVLDVQKEQRVGPFQNLGEKNGFVHLGFGHSKRLAMFSRAKGTGRAAFASRVLHRRD